MKYFIIISILMLTACEENRDSETDTEYVDTETDTECDNIICNKDPHSECFNNYVKSYYGEAICINGKCYYIYETHFCPDGCITKYFEEYDKKASGCASDF